MATAKMMPRELRFEHNGEHFKAILVDEVPLSPEPCSLCRKSLYGRAFYITSPPSLSVHADCARECSIFFFFQSGSRRSLGPGWHNGYYYSGAAAYYQHMNYTAPPPPYNAGQQQPYHQNNYIYSTPPPPYNGQHQHYYQHNYSCTTPPPPYNYNGQQQATGSFGTSAGGSSLFQLLGLTAISSLLQSLFSSMMGEFGFGADQ